MVKKIEEALDKVDPAKVEATEVDAGSETVVESSDGFDADTDIAAIFSGMDLSEEFKTKAKTVYEASVVAMATQISEKVTAEVEAAKEAEIAAIKEQAEADFVAAKETINEQVSDYLKFVTENWLEENKLEAENIVRTELSESFMEKLAVLMREHYVELPDDKIDLVAELQDKVEESTVELNKVLEQVVELRKANETLVRESALKDVAVGLTDMEQDKFNRLAEAVEFTNVEEFSGKLNEIKESYFTASKEAVVDTSLDNQDPVVIEEEVIKTEGKPAAMNYNNILKHLGRTSRVIPTSR